MATGKKKGIPYIRAFEVLVTRNKKQHFLVFEKLETYHKFFLQSRQVWKMIFLKAATKLIVTDKKEKSWFRTNSTRAKKTESI